MKERKKVANPLLGNLWPKRLSWSVALLLMMADPLWVKAVYNVWMLACIVELRPEAYYTEL